MADLSRDRESDGGEEETPPPAPRAVQPRCDGLPVLVFAADYERARLAARSLCVGRKWLFMFGRDNWLGHGGSPVMVVGPPGPLFAEAEPYLRSRHCPILMLADSAVG